MYGLEMDYPLNLSMGIGIGTVRLNSRYKQIVAPTIREGVHSHFITTYLKQLWGYSLCLTNIYIYGFADSSYTSAKFSDTAHHLLHWLPLPIPKTPSSLPLLLESYLLAELA